MKHNKSNAYNNIIINVFNKKQKMDCHCKQMLDNVAAQNIVLVSINITNCLAEWTVINGNGVEQKG